MIIQIRGTSGSGKTTVMKTVMDLMGNWQAIGKTGRKKPWYYQSVSEWPCTVVLGHYESACGGCDTIGSAAAVYDLIQELQTGENLVPEHILCEGLLLSEDVKWSLQMKDLHVYYLDTPLSTCLKQIESRRAEAGNTKELNPANTTNRIRTIERSKVKLLEAGVSCYECSSSEAPELILNQLRLHAQGS
jgi:hypothetical protein